MLRRVLRRLAYSSAIGPVHSEIIFVGTQYSYAGPGWAAVIKELPIDTLTMMGGSSLANCNDRVGHLPDPEDPRHPLGVMQFGLDKPFDSNCLTLIQTPAEVPSPGNRLMQVLYDNYLEPFSMNRVCAQLTYYEKVPNNHHQSVNFSCAYIGQTASIVGSVVLCMDSVVMEGVTIKGDTNTIYIGEGVQVLENSCIVSDAPTDLLAYQRDEMLNPYQQWDGMDGVTRVQNNTIIEPNCFLDSCSIGSYCRIGHNSKIMKGVTTGILVHILPGSVVTADTHIGDGELWGGAPAVKLGEVSDFEWKRPYYPSLLHKESVLESYRNLSHYGDQVVHFTNAMGELDTLMIKYENHVTPAMREKILDFEEGREPYSHALARMTQGWSPMNRAPDVYLSIMPPLPGVKVYAEHNTDSSDDKLQGTYLNITNVFNDFRW